MIRLKGKQLERIEKKLDSILKKLEEKEPSSSYGEEAATIIDSYAEYKNNTLSRISRLSDNFR